MKFWQTAMLLLLWTMAGAAQAAAPVTFYVATKGSDQWTGRLSAPNAGKTDGPLAPLARAQTAKKDAEASAGASRRKSWQAEKILVCT